MKTVAPGDACVFLHFACHLYVILRGEGAERTEITSHIYAALSQLQERKSLGS